MWTLSLGSKELFHSTLLGWLCERLPVAAAARLLGCCRATRRPNSIGSPASLTTSTLTVRLPGYEPAVVENKVFSLPQLSQLAGTPRTSRGPWGRIPT
jgi:hypothetical protein